MIASLRFYFWLGIALRCSHFQHRWIDRLHSFAIRRAAGMS